MKTIKQILDIKLIIMLILLFWLMSSCSAPFLVGKNHQLVLGNNKPKKKEIVKVLEVIHHDDETLSVIFISEGDTVALDALIRKEFAGMFIPVEGK